MFPNQNFHNIKAPLEKNDHPVLDSTEICNEEQVTKFLCMIGQLQWAGTLVRYDIQANVMSMSGFRLAPKNWTPREIEKAYGYLSKMKHFAISYMTKEPNYSH